MKAVRFFAGVFFASIPESAGRSLLLVIGHRWLSVTIGHSAGRPSR